MVLKPRKEVPLSTKDKVLFCSFDFYNSVWDWKSFTPSGVIGKEAFAPKSLTADDVFITMLLTIHLQCQYEAQNGHRPSRLRSRRSIKEDVSFTFNAVRWVMYSLTLYNDSNYERLWAASLKGFVTCFESLETQNKYLPDLGSDRPYWRLSLWSLAPRF